MLKIITMFYQDSQIMLTNNNNVLSGQPNYVKNINNVLSGQPNYVNE